MRLLEAIVDANHRAVAGDAKAGVHPGEFVEELPIVALTCVDARLNALLPNVLGLPKEQFIWLRNAGNIITGPTSSTMRSLALACAVKGGKEIVIIGHTDCQVGKLTAMQLLERFKALGVDRGRLPDNLVEFFGLFGSDRQNVIKSADIARQSPLIGAKVPVHGLLLNIETGGVEWVVNGYQVAETFADRWQDLMKSADQTVQSLKSLGDFEIGDKKLRETKIGETVERAENWISEKIRTQISAPVTPASSPAPVRPVPPAAPQPPRLPPQRPPLPRMTIRKRPTRP